MSKRDLQKQKLEEELMELYAPVWPFIHVMVLNIGRCAGALCTSLALYPCHGFEYWPNVQELCAPVWPFIHVMVLNIGRYGQPKQMTEAALFHVKQPHLDFIFQVILSGNTPVR
ncbi:hypothetical protein ACLOJK_023705 [Asimina triloba]